MREKVFQNIGYFFSPLCVIGHAKMRKRILFLSYEKSCEYAIQFGRKFARILGEITTFFCYISHVMHIYDFINF